MLLIRSGLAQEVALITVTVAAQNYRNSVRHTNGRRCKSYTCITHSLRLTLQTRSHSFPPSLLPLFPPSLFPSFFPPSLHLSLPPSQVRAIAAGAAFSTAITTDGEVYTWGQATSHPASFPSPEYVSLYSPLPSGLGHGDLADKLVPTPHSQTMLFCKTVTVQ